MRFTKATIIAAPVTAASLLFCMGNTSCGSQHGTAGIAVGNAVAGAPIGIVSRTGADYQKTIWATGLLTAATIAAAEHQRYVLHLTDNGANLLSSSPRNPCKDENGRQILVSWVRLRLGNSYQINCDNWRRIWRSNPRGRVKSVQSILKCIENVLLKGTVNSGPSGVIYKSGTSWVEVVGNRIISASSPDWTNCADGV